jgi:predicted nucleotidyltransferase
MTNLIDQHRDEIANLCRKSGARRLDVFGSVLRENWGKLGCVTGMLAG